MHRIERIAIAGVPNCGKTSLFNSLTGSLSRFSLIDGKLFRLFDGQSKNKENRTCDSATFFRFF